MTFMTLELKENNNKNLIPQFWFTLIYLGLII